MVLWLACISQTTAMCRNFLRWYSSQGFSRSYLAVVLQVHVSFKFLWLQRFRYCYSLILHCLTYPFVTFLGYPSGRIPLTVMQKFCRQTLDRITAVGYSGTFAHQVHWTWSRFSSQLCRPLITKKRFLGFISMCSIVVLL